MNPTPKNETIKVTSAVGANEPAEVTPSPLQRHLSAKAARERLLTARNEAFPRSSQYRPAGDSMGHVGSGEG